MAEAAARLGIGRLMPNAVPGIETDWCTNLLYEESSIWLDGFCFCFIHLDFLPTYSTDFFPFESFGEENEKG